MSETLPSIAVYDTPLIHDSQQKAGEHLSDTLRRYKVEQIVSAVSIDRLDRHRLQEVAADLDRAPVG